MIIIIFDLRIHQFFNHNSITATSFNFLIILLHYSKLNWLIIINFLILISYFFNLKCLILLLLHLIPLPSN